MNRIRAMKPDYIFSFYYRDMLGGEILSIPSKGAINLHGSLLPKYRGRVPLNWAIINGETEAGVTLHYMTKKADAGDIISQEKFAITDDDTAKTVFDKAAEAAKVLLDRELPKIAAGTASRTPQDESKATTFGGRKPADGEIDWTKSAKEVRNLIRAVTKLYPGAFSYIGDRKCFFWSADVADQDRKAAPGTVLSAAPFTIACGEGALRIRTAQLETGVFMTGDQLAAEARIVPNMVFGANPKKLREQGRKKSVLILGVNGFIGSHLSERLLDSGKYEVYGLDLRSNYIDHLLGREGFHFREGDISIHREWIEYHI
ncbi:MAG: formyltransferase family protein, partial [Victivallis sp.]